MKKIAFNKNIYIKVVAVAVWLVIWQVVAMLISNKLMLASPVQTVSALIKMSAEGAFWKSIFGSFYHIALGFLLAVTVGVALSVLAYKVRYVKEFLAPAVTTLNTVPVASFIVLLLISLRSKENLSTIICFMMSLPIVYANTLAGLRATDNKMLEMARVFRVSRGKKLAYLYVYETLPSFTTGAKIALGLCWKSGVAAELIGLVQNTIGNELYYAKLYLTMDRVFAWTVVIVAVSLAFELLVLGALRLVKRGVER